MRHAGINPQRPTRDEPEAGFTLIELMIVVLILGVLLAIAVPTYIGLQNGSRKGAAESDLTIAVQDESAYIVGAGGGTTYGSATESPSVDAGIVWATDTGTASNALTSATLTASAKNVGAWVSTSGTPEVVLDTLGRDGVYYWADVKAGSITYATTTSATGPTGSTPFSTSKLP